MAEAMGSMDRETLEPLSNFSCHPLFDREWIEKITEAIQRLRAKRASPELIAESIAGVSHLRAQLLFLLMDMKSARIEKKRRIVLAEFFHDLLLTKAKTDPYGFQSNIMHSPKEYDALMKKPFAAGSPDISLELARLYSAAYHLANGLYTDFYTDYAVENFGPYHIGKDTIKVIKKVHDLRPLLLWNYSGAPCTSVTVYTILKNVRFRCDGISCHTTYEGDPVLGLEQYSVEIDGRIIIHNLEDIISFRKRLERESQTQWQHLTNLQHEALKQKAVEMRCYVWKDFFTLAGIEWKPSAEMARAVQKPLVLDLWQPPEGDQVEFWKKVMDPEDEFLGHNNHNL